MRLRITDLQKIVEQTIQEKQAIDSFCDEIKKAFGPTVVVSNTLESLVEQANYRLDVLERTGRESYISFSSKIALPLSSHKDPEVRRLVVRLLPESAAVSFINDKNSKVRVAAAKKSPLKLVENVAKDHKDDDLLQDVLFQKRLVEEKSALDLAEQGPQDEDEFLSDWWYEKTARQLIQDYGRTLDTTWVPAAVKQVCSNRSVNRYNVDPYKLMKVVVKIIADRDSEKFDRLENAQVVIKESANTSFITNEETPDLVSDLLESKLSQSEYLQRADIIFGIKYASIPPGIKKYTLGEVKAGNVEIPVVGSLPHLLSPRFVDERALDTYVNYWNSRQSLKGEPYKLSWAPHSSSQNKINFHLELK